MLGNVYSGEKIDMWSVGVILYIMVTGTAPFRGESVAPLSVSLSECVWPCLCLSLGLGLCLCLCRCLRLYLYLYLYLYL